MNSDAVDLVIGELDTLLSEMRAGLQPSNPSLSEAVWYALRRKLAAARQPKEQ